MKLGFGMKQLKSEGVIRHYGFSFHSTPEHLEQLLTDHPDAEFVQLQINYADIPCTACHYCTPGCLMGIHIPEIFAVMNVYKMYGNLTEARNEYRWRPGGNLASTCIQCGQCEGACPQHLPIIRLLEEVVETLEK